MVVTGAVVVAFPVVVVLVTVWGPSLEVVVTPSTVVAAVLSPVASAAVVVV